MCAEEKGKWGEVRKKEREGVMGRKQEGWE
jgi:hypothetical protein